MAGAENIILNYDRPRVRARTRSDLAEMAREGARAARTILWYRQAEDLPMARWIAAKGRDVLGMPVAADGKLPSDYITNLKAFASDLVARGYVRYYVNIAPMGTSNPRTRPCKRSVKDCFNPHLLSLNWSVAQQVISALRAAVSGKIDLVFDLVAESCFFDPSSSVQYDRELNTVVRYMLTRYKETFGSGGFVLSCGSGNGNVGRAVRGFRSLVTLYRRQEVKPAAIDLHIYATRPDGIKALLRAANQAAGRLGVPVDIGETFSDNRLILGTISKMVAAGRLNLRTIIMFPLRTGNPCMVPAPYDISGFDAMLGRRSASGAEKPICR